MFLEVLVMARAAPDKPLGCIAAGGEKIKLGVLKLARPEQVEGFCAELQAKALANFAGLQDRYGGTMRSGRPPAGTLLTANHDFTIVKDGDGICDTKLGGSWPHVPLARGDMLAARHLFPLQPLHRPGHVLRSVGRRASSGELSGDGSFLRVRMRNCPSAQGISGAAPNSGCRAASSSAATR